MKFAKTFDSKRYGQIVVIEKQDKEGAPEIRFFFKPDGFGVCDFGIGFETDGAESRMHQAFESITPQEATELVDGYMKHMQDTAQAQH
jgi:hypothetical protein